MESTERNTRRNFLLAAGLGGAAAVAVVATARITAEAAAPDKPVERQTQGYRASAHILQYYKTAQV